MKKKVFGLILVLGMLVLMIVPVAAASHSGTYDMTGGIFYKQSFNSETEMLITIMPSTGTSDCNIGIYTAKKRFILGWQDTDYINSVSSVSYSETRYTTKEAIDGIYFRNWSGNRWIGSFTVDW